MLRLLPKSQRLRNPRSAAASTAFHETERQMGKRKKSTRGPQKKIKQVLPTTFTCLFCNHDDSVMCVMDKKVGVGNLNCKVCGQSFQSPINALSAPVDVYSDWVDACEAVAAKPGASSVSALPEVSDGEDY